MVNTISKMHRNNARIKKKLKLLGFTHIYLFPHTRHSKDLIIDNMGFDAVAFRNKLVWFFQFKSNKKCPGIVMRKYTEIEDNYDIVCAWISVFDKNKNKCPEKYKGKIILWGSNYSQELQ